VPWRGAAVGAFASGLAVLVLAACAATAGTPAAGNVTGHVYGEPGCPVQRAESPCPPRLMSGMTLNFRSGAGSVESTKTDSNGAYSIELAPGSWKVTLVAQPSGRLLRGPTQVSVAAGKVTMADFTVDSGIR
jgi:hypothetical protein